VRIKTTAGILASIAAIAVSGQTSFAQAPITAIKLSKDQIGLVKTAQGLSTRISFPEPVKEIICGDLYDAANNRGTFVLQRGDNDVFVKPIASKGISNLFVKTGDKGQHIYNFDLVIVSPMDALRVVNVTGDFGTANGSAPPDPEAEARSRKQADDTIRQAQAQAATIVTKAQDDANALVAEASERVRKNADRKFLNALMLGLREEKIISPRVAAPNGVIVTLDQHIVIFDDKSYIRYTIHNVGTKDFTFDRVLVEDGAGKSLTAEVTPAKAGNTVKPGESLVGIVVFDSYAPGKKDKLTLSVLGEGSAEIARFAVVAQ